MSEQKAESINKPLLTVGDVPSKKAKRSLVSRSGKQFESVDHYIAENIVQTYYPNNNKDLELIEKEDDSVSPVSGGETNSSSNKNQRNPPSPSISPFPQLFNFFLTTFLHTEFLNKKTFFPYRNLDPENLWAS